MQDEPGFTGFSMVEFVGVLVRRRAMVFGVLAAALVAAGAASLLSEERYASTATVFPLTQSTLQLEWLSSRTVAGVVLDEHGEALLPLLFPQRWDEAAGRWKGDPPTRHEAEAALSERVDVRTGPGGAKGPSRSVLVVTATLPDEELSRSVAQAYVDTLPLLRPSLENVTFHETFRSLYHERYNASNVDGALDRARVTVATTTFWIVLDEAGPAELVWPNHLANAIAGSLGGLVLGVAAATAVEWIARHRARWDARTS